jgi:hypothetical protein
MLADAVDSARGLGDRVVGSARELGKSAAGAVGDLFDEVRGLGTNTERSFRESSIACPSCRHPRACWMPDERVPIISKVSPCGSARVTFTVRNCGLIPREVFGAPSTATIGALESATLVAELALPDGTTEANVILWVRGCKDTAVPWTVKASGCATSTDHHVHIEDCPDTKHHWHDHFAQPRDCRNRRRG